MTAEKTIVLIEDNPDDVELALRALKKNNITNQVLIASDGEQALKLLFGNEDEIQDNNKALPVVVLLDLKLPKIDGLQVLKQIRQTPRTSLLPVVILTSSDEERDLVESYRLGANSYIRKPVDFARFTEAVGQLGLYWLLLNQPPPREE